MDEILRYLLGAPLARSPIESVEPWWAAHLEATRPFAVPVDRALAGGRRADRLGWAFASGYQAALAALVPALPRDHLVALCATENGGAHPRAIETSLREDGGAFVLNGQKRFVTLGPHARELLVVASVGTSEDGRNRLRVVHVETSAPGVLVATMGPTPFAPEIPHAEVVLRGVRVAASELLEGDGYSRYLKPFRTVEDVHVHAALLGYLLGVARSASWARETLAHIVALVVTARSLALADPSSPATHVALAGLIEETRLLLDATGAAWNTVGDDERARWERDRGLLSVASAARAKRAARAFEAFVT